MSPDHSFAALFSEAWALLLQPTTWFVAAVVLVSGVVRGFSGFGGALIFIPLTAALLGPRKAVAVFYLFDLVSATPYGYTYFPKARWKELAPMLVGAVLMQPVGAYVLKFSDPLLLRWILSGVVLAMLAVLVTGWRYRNQPTPPVSFGLGLVAGLAGGSTGVSGPIVIAYWLSSAAAAAVIRANIMSFYAVTSTTTDVIFFLNGLFTWDVAVYALIAWPLYSLGLAVGARVFKGTNDAQYRKVAYALIFLSAVISLPIFDSLIR
ncbi:MAG: sulfite exporter TauE/SafE family protein [Beijerinckiaceae bacterium]